MISILQWLILVLIFGNKLLAYSPTGLPTHACSFYKNPGWFRSCAEPKSKYGACKKTKCTMFGCYKYPGVKVSMYLPDYLIETTRFPGDSAFSAIPSFKKQLKFAKKYQESRKTVKWPKANISGRGALESRDHKWNARLLPVPFGGLNTYPNVKAGSGGNLLPTCMSGISEFLTDQWDYNLADLPVTLPFSDVKLTACYSPAGRLSQEAFRAAAVVGREMIGTALDAIGISGDLSVPDFGVFCAYPVNAKVMLTKNLAPGSDAFDPSKMCMGGMGGLLPRRGNIAAENRRKTSQMAAWRFASLVEDVYGWESSGMNLDHKWQIMYPKSSRGGCYRAGSVDDLVPVVEGRGLGVESSPKTNSYIYGIWRYREACLEPWDGTSWPAKWELDFQAHVAFCQAVR